MKIFLKKVIISIMVTAVVLCFAIAVYYLGNSLIKSTDIQVNLKNIDSKDSISTIMTATDNAINKIYNILVVSTIFFTLLVATVSIFQYFKTKDIDEYKKEFEDDLKNALIDLKSKIEPAEKKVGDVEQQLNQKVLEYDEKIKEIENLKNELTIQKIGLDRKSAELEIEVSFLKAKEALEQEYSDSAMIRITEYLKIIDISKRFEDIMPIERLAITYNNIALAYEDACSYDQAEGYYKKSFDIKQQADTELSIVCSNLARLSYKQGRLDKTLSYCDKAYEFNEKNVFLYILRALALERTSKSDNMNEALSNLRIALSINFKLTEDIVKSSGNSISNDFKDEIDRMKQGK